VSTATTLSSSKCFMAFSKNSVHLLLVRIEESQHLPFCRPRPPVPSVSQAGDPGGRGPKQVPPMGEGLRGSQLLAWSARRWTRHFQPGEHGRDFLGDSGDRAQGNGTTSLLQVHGGKRGWVGDVPDTNTLINKSHLYRIHFASNLQQSPHN